MAGAVPHDSLSRSPWRCCLPLRRGLALIPLEAVGLLAVAGGIFAWAAFGLSPRARAAWGLAICVVIIGSFIGASRVARRAAVDALHPVLRGPVTDVILTPNPASPALLVCDRRRASRDGRRVCAVAGDAVAGSGVDSHRRRARSHRLAGARDDPDPRRWAGSRCETTRSQSLTRLRKLAEGDCWVRAWLRFGRAPVVDGGSIYDLRFAERIGQNFSRMELAPRRGCPSNVPNWGMPRADLLEPKLAKEITE